MGGRSGFEGYRAFEYRPILDGTLIKDEQAVGFINLFRTLMAPNVVNQTDLYIRALELQESEKTSDNTQGDAIIAYLISRNANLDSADIAAAQALKTTSLPPSSPSGE